MKKGGERGKPRPHGSSTFDAISDWASLLPELVQGIADCVLSTTGGVDAYMDMRAVCPSWRSAIAKPSPLAAVADLRFRPRQWLMVDMRPDNHDDDARLFLHVPTGRFRRLRLPVLRDHILVGATDGLLVLGEREPPHFARVLNPFTGDMIHFAAPLSQDLKDRSKHTTVAHSVLVFLISSTVYYAAPASDVFTEKDFSAGGYGPPSYLDCMVNFQGSIYCADMHGWLCELVAPEELKIIDEVDDDVDREEEFSELCSYLVESAGELLLVRYTERSFKVFRLNTEYMLLEEVKSLGGRALFLGEERCVSVDADKLPSVDGDCIYKLDYEGRCDMCVYNLRTDMLVDIVSRKHYLNGPFSLVMVLLHYCDFRILSSLLETWSICEEREIKH